MPTHVKEMAMFETSASRPKNEKSYNFVDLDFAEVENKCAFVLPSTHTVLASGEWRQSVTGLWE